MSLVVVAGAVASTAHRGGDTWHRLHWLLGLRRLGADVHFVEQMPDPSADGVGYFDEALAAFGFSDCATLLGNDGERVRGLGLSDLRQLFEDADLFVNISGHLAWKGLTLAPRRAVFVDEDPGFTQMWHVSGLLGDRLDGHDFYYSVSANVGTAACDVPTGGIAWRPLRPFAVLEQWPVVDDRTFDRFTTVGAWRGPCGALEFQGRKYGVKAHEFRKFGDVPRRSAQPFELALDIHPDERSDLALLHHGGWRLIDPRGVAGTPQAFRSYVQQSGAEFSVAKGMYVDTNSGWFSDRTIRYLASGRPVLVQDTGFSAEYRVGTGLLAFRTFDEAVDGSQRIARDYAEHCEAARAIAEDYFDSDHVLGRFLDEVGVTP